MPDIRVGRPVFLKIFACHVHDMIPESKVNILPACRDQPLIGRHHILIRRHHRIILGVREPDRLSGDRSDIFVRDRAVRQRLTHGKRRRVSVRIMKQHLHSHKPAVGIPAQVDSVPVNLLMPVDKIRDQPLQRLYIHGRSVLSVLPGAVVHPHGRRLRRQQISAAEHLLYPG